MDVLGSDGIDVIFGIPGAATLPLYDEIYDSDIRHILARHEQGASHMADGYARMKGTPGVCLSTSGAGATNLVTGITTAYLDSSPVIALTGQVPTHLLGSDGFQEADIFSLMMPITKHNFRVTDVGTLETDLRSALRISMEGRPGPVHLDIPRDVFESEFPFTGLRYEPVAPHPPDPRRLPEAMRLLSNADRPLMLLGGGARISRAGNAAIKLAEALSIPIATTLMGKGSVSETHALVLGMAGMHGKMSANIALDQCDVLLVVGARFSDRTVGDPESCKMKVIHIDVDQGELGKNLAADIAINGDCRLTLEAMSALIPFQVFSSTWSDRNGRLIGRCSCDIDVQENPISVRKVIHELDKFIPDDGVICTEVGQCQMFAAHYLTIKGDRRFITSGGLGTMGFGLPAAIGAKVADPERMVLDIAGDGSFTMVCQEMATAVNEDIPITVVLLNNGQLGMIRQHQKLFYSSRFNAENLGNTDMVALAKAFGAGAVRVDDHRDIASALEEATGSGRPYLLDIQINRDEDIFPLTLRTANGIKIHKGSCPFDGGC